MAIVATKGKPAFFITIIMDPKCPKVMVQIEPDQTPYDRPDIICQVFDLKKKNILAYISRENYIEKIDGKVAVIEFQKWGVPHCHMVF